MTGQVQSNYFGKGQTTTYNRGAFHPANGNHDGFKTYSIDWTAEQIVWSIDGVTVRALTYANAATGQYPQTPMQIKVGAWSGGDSSNAPGTIAWAGGPNGLWCRSIYHVPPLDRSDRLLFRKFVSILRDHQEIGNQSKRKVAR